MKNPVRTTVRALVYAALSTALIGWIIGGITVLAVDE